MTDRPAITPEEIRRRRKAYKQALACERIEGNAHDPITDPIVEAFIFGEIDGDEAITRIKALLGVG
jgi:hypothetical protein